MKIFYLMFAFYVNVKWPIYMLDRCETPEYYYIPNNTDGTLDPNRAYSSEEYLKVTEEQLKESAAQPQGKTPPKEGENEPQIQPPG